MEITNAKWELAYYLIDAKEAVDNLSYIGQHIMDIYDVQDTAYERRSRYYINLCKVMDHSVYHTPESKRSRKEDSVVTNIYYQRDKYYAHNDKRYNAAFPYRSISDEADVLKRWLVHIYDICHEYLPDNLTLDFVNYDARLFRMIEKISPKDEKIIFRQKYPMVELLKRYVKPDGVVKLVWSLEDIKNIPEGHEHEYGVMVKDGLTLEEGIQTIQKGLILSNCLLNSNIWMHPVRKHYNELLRYRELGLINPYNIPNFNKMYEYALKHPTMFEPIQKETD